VRCTLARRLGGGGVQVGDKIWTTVFPKSWIPSSYDQGRNRNLQQPDYLSRKCYNDLGHYLVRGGVGCVVSEG
jgi:hypothetical protein